VKELLALFYTTPFTIFTTTAEELRAKVRAKQQKLIYGTNWYIQLTGITTDHKMCGNAQ